MPPSDSPDFPLDYLTRLDASDSYVPTAEGLQLFSDGRRFYSAEKLPRSAFAYSFHAEVATTVHVTNTALVSPIGPPSPIQPVSSPGVLDTPPPDDEVRSLIEQYIQAAPWFREQAHEPLVGDEGVPTCAVQLAPKGESVYRCFVVPGKSKKNKLMFKCATCEYTSDLLRRVVGHQRAKREHKPFACGDVGCQFRGPTKESLSDHRSKRNDATWCPECREPIVIKNLNRHLQDVHRN